jgi:hypothetical protein
MEAQVMSSGTVQIVTAAIAAGGLALSIFNTFKQIQSEHRRLDITLGFGLTTGPIVESVLVLRAANRGSSDVIVVGCGLQLPGPRTAVLIGTREIPKRLVSGDGLIESERLDVFKARMREEGLQGHVPVRAFFNDATGQTHVSRKPLMVDVAS